jgi:hypothetical protein
MSAQTADSTTLARKDIALGRVLPGFKLGRARRWVRAEVERWLAAGAPPAVEWEQLKKSSR